MDTLSHHLYRLVFMLKIYMSFKSVACRIPVLIQFIFVCVDHCKQIIYNRHASLALMPAFFIGVLKCLNIGTSFTWKFEELYGLWRIRQCIGCFKWSHYCEFQEWFILCRIVAKNRKWEIPAGSKFDGLNKIKRMEICQLFYWFCLEFRHKLSSLNCFFLHCVTSQR